MDLRISYVGFFDSTVSANWRDVAATHAKHFGLNLDEKRSHETEIRFGGGDGRPRLVLRLNHNKWSDFGVFALRPQFLDIVGADKVVPWLLTISDELRCSLARTFSDETVPMLEETALGPNCLDWLQYFGPEVAKRWSFPFLQKGPFHNVVGFKSGGVGIQLGPSPFEHLMSIRAAADYLGLNLRPRMSTNGKGEAVEREWP
jgi:hypothetical protein